MLGVLFQDHCRLLPFFLFALLVTLLVLLDLLLYAFQVVRLVDQLFPHLLLFHAGEHLHLLIANDFVML
jgi:hypothetical protein